MDGTHPKRKKDKYNPYIISIENGEHFISFKDGSGTFQKIPTSPDLYSLFNDFELEDISHMNVVTRYWEHSELSEETINARAFSIPVTVEDSLFLACEKEDLHKAIRQLSDTQRRRLYLYYWEGLTYEQIADLERCSHPAVIKSINGAIQKIKKYFLEMGYNLADN